MTVSSNTNRKSFTGNAVTTSFGTSPMVFFDTSDLKVYVVTTATGAATLLTENTHYTVSGGAGSTGTVSLAGGSAPYGAPSAAQTLLIVRELPLTQETDLANNDASDAEVVEDALDRLTIIAQQLEDANNRALTLPTSDVSGASTELPVPSASTLIGWNSTGTALENKTSADVNLTLVSAFIATLLDDADAAAARSTLGTLASDLSTLTAETAPDVADLLPLRDVSAGTTDHTTLANLFKVINGLTADSSPDTAADYIVTYDASAAAAKKVLLSTLLGGVTQPNMQQTVLSGPVDSAGLPSFGGSTGSTTVTMSGTLAVTAANGATNRIGTGTNLAWTGLSTNGTMYLYVDVNADGTLTTGSTTLAPTYQEGGTYSTTNNQFTFNTSEMVGKVGNGSAANQTYRTFVGQVTVAGGVVTAITWYAVRGRYVGAWTSTIPAVGTAISRTHNIGVAPEHYDIELECTSADAGYAVGDRARLPMGTSGGASSIVTPWATALTCGFTTPNTTTLTLGHKTTGVYTTLTTANWKYRMQAKRGW